MGKEQNSLGSAFPEILPETTSILLRPLLVLPREKFPEDVLKGLYDLTDREIQKFSQLSEPENPRELFTLDQEKQYETAYRHRDAVNNLKNTLSEKRDTIVLIYAQDCSTSGIVAFSAGLLKGRKDGKQVVSTYIGTTSEPKYNRKGLASKLIAIRNRIFLENGVISYRTSVADTSLALYESLVKLNALNINPEEDDLGIGRNLLRVSYTEEQLKILYDNLGLDYTKGAMSDQIVEI